MEHKRNTLSISEIRYFVLIDKYQLDCELMLLHMKTESSQCDNYTENIIVSVTLLALHICVHLEFNLFCVKEEIITEMRIYFCCVCNHTYL